VTGASRALQPLQVGSQQTESWNQIPGLLSQIAVGSAGAVYGINSSGQIFWYNRIAMGTWLTALEMRAPRNVLIIAMANKLARIAWAVLATGQDYRAVPDAAAA
jgi:hypothetical protein